MSEKEVLSFILSHYNDVCDLKPIGNHHLKRHLVYSFSSMGEKMVVKLFYKKDRWNREVSANKLLSTRGVKVPTMMKYGKNDDFEWIIYEFKQGEVLNDIKSSIPKEDLLHIYINMGEQLALIHSAAEFKGFGTLNEDCTWKTCNQSFKESFALSINPIMDSCLKKEHDDKDLIVDSVYSMKNKIADLYDVATGTLCHNDFDGRNILVRKIDGRYKLVSILDFEQSSIGDPDNELFFIQHNLNNLSGDYYRAFCCGYNKQRFLNIENVKKKSSVLLLKGGLTICAWARDVAHDYYKEGMELLKEGLKHTK